MGSAHGNLYVVSGPAGVGKGTIVAEVRKRIPNVGFSVSCTTRAPRPGLDEEGKTYYFLSEADFLKHVNEGDFLEYASVHGHYYGTRKDIVQKTLDSGQDIILEIDVQGAFAVKEKMPEALLIFIKPPSFEELAKRLKGRASESETEQQLRLSNAQKELACADRYDYAIINDRLEDAVSDFIKIMEKQEK